MIALIDCKISNNEAILKMIQKFYIEPDLNRDPTRLDRGYGNKLSSAGSITI